MWVLFLAVELSSLAAPRDPRVEVRGQNLSLPPGERDEALDQRLSSVQSELRTCFAWPGAPTSVAVRWMETPEGRAMAVRVIDPAPAAASVAPCFEGALAHSHAPLGGPSAFLVEARLEEVVVAPPLPVGTVSVRIGIERRPQAPPTHVVRPLSADNPALLSIGSQVTGPDGEGVQALMVAQHGPLLACYTAVGSTRSLTVQADLTSAWPGRPRRARLVHPQGLDPALRNCLEAVLGGVEVKGPETVRWILDFSPPSGPRVPSTVPTVVPG